MGVIRHFYNLSQTVEQAGLDQNAELIMLVQRTFWWDEAKKGDGIKVFPLLQKLSNQNLTATKNGQSDYQTVLGNFEIFTGSHYWEIKVEFKKSNKWKIQKFVDEEDLFVGVARRGVDLHMHPCETN